MVKANGNGSRELFEEFTAPVITEEQREYIQLVEEFQAQMSIAMGLAMQVQERGARIVLSLQAPEKEKKPHAIKALLTYFDVKHQERIRDPESGEPVRAKIDGGKDSMLMKRLIGTYGEDKLKPLIDRFFALDDEWITQRTGYTVAAFSSRVASLLSSASVPARAIGVTNNTRDNGRRAVQAEEMIQRAYGGRR
jgi:hypothetical protein